MTQPGSLGSTFDQTGDVGDHKAAAFASAHDSEVRMQRGERIVSDLGSRVRNRGDQCGLASVRHSEQADICQQTQLKLQLALLAEPAGRFLAWRPIGAALEVQVAEAAIS